MSRCLLLTVAIAFVGCSDLNERDQTAHWTVTGIEMGEIGEYLPDGLPPGTPLGYTIDYAKCQRGNEVIFLEAYNGYVPGGLAVGDRFKFKKPLKDLTTIDQLGYDGPCYRVTDDDLATLPSTQ